MVSTVVKTWLFLSSVLFVTCLKTIISNHNMIEMKCVITVKSLIKSLISEF